jgi:hypothetical protein
MELQALDPNYKTIYTKNMWDEEDYEAGIARLEQVVHDILAS